MTEPTDKQLEDFAVEEQFLLFCDVDEFTQIARAVLEKWGNPAVAGEQVGWMWQHDETGRTGFVDCWQVENGWQEGNPRLRLISKLYTTPQPTQPQAGAVPMTDEQIEALPLWKRFVGLWPETRREIVRTIERHHGIKGGQHDTE